MVTQPGSPLRGAIVLITGGSRGIGRLYAHRLAAEGAVVVLVARSTAELDEVARSIRAEGGKVATYVVDVTSKPAVARVVGRIEKRLGPLDVLINNAGIRGPIGNAWECDWDAWWRAIEVNLGGAAAFSHTVIPNMARRRKGRVVNIVSEAGVFRWPTVSAYSVSKAALIKFSENLAAECRDFSLSVFAYHPGFLPLGLANQAMDPHVPMSPAETRVAVWCRAQLASTAAALPGESAAQLIRLLSGAYDSLTGRYVTVHDDLDLLVARVRMAAASKDYRMLRSSA